MAPDPPVIKLIYLARRRGDLDSDQFVRRWRRHGALGMSMDFWANHLRYAQCSVRAEVTGRGSMVPSDFDAIGMLWYRPGRRRAFPSDAKAREAMLADERETFAEPVSSCQVFAVEHGVTSESATVALKLVRVFDVGPVHASTGQPTVWDDDAQRLRNAHPGIVRHVLNLVTEPATEDCPLRGSAVDEIGFAVPGHLLDAIRSDDLTVLRDASGNRIGSARVFVSDEVVLYDAGQLAPLSLPA